MFNVSLSIVGRDGVLRKTDEKGIRGHREGFTIDKFCLISGRKIQK